MLNWVVHIVTTGVYRTRSERTICCPIENAAPITASYMVYVFIVFDKLDDKEDRRQLQCWQPAAVGPSPPFRRPRPLRYRLQRLFYCRFFILCVCVCVFSHCLSLLFHWYIWNVYILFLMFDFVVLFGTRGLKFESKLNNPRTDPKLRAMRRIKHIGHCMSVASCFWYHQLLWTITHNAVGSDVSVVIWAHCWKW